MRLVARQRDPIPTREAKWRYNHGVIVLTAYCQVQEDKIEEFLEACHENRAKALVEPGCDRFDYYMSIEENMKCVFVEEWGTMAHLEAHFATAHFADFMAKAKECLAREPEVRIFEATLRA